jgi:starch phosphorylase
MSILNTASSGRFSTDRTMRGYNRQIWRLEPVAPHYGAGPRS